MDAGTQEQERLARAVVAPRNVPTDPPARSRPERGGWAWYGRSAYHGG